MPLPSSAGQWPPATFAKAQEQIQVYDAWYTGDVEALGYLYAINRLQKRTSVWGQVRRMFWGTPTPETTTQRPNKIHVPVAAEVARMSSQTLFSEMPAVHFDDQSNTSADSTDEENTQTASSAKTATERLVELLDDSAHACLLETAEYASAHGGAFIRVTWDMDVVPDRPFLTAVATDTAVPEFRWGRLTAVTFWRDLPPLEGDNRSFKLLERHDIGRIEWGLYTSADNGALGMRVPITDHPDTAMLGDVVDMNAGIDTGSKLLTAVYIPNLQPNGAWRKDPQASNLGRSDLAGAEDLMDQLDEVYTSWMRDVRLGKARIMVPKNLLNPGTPGQGAIFNADQEIFTQLGEMVGSLNPAATGSTVQDSMQMFQPLIRYQEHMDTAIHLLARIYASCGFSPQSFGDAGADGAGGITATEVNAREKLTILTRSAKILYMRPQLQNIFAALMDVDEFAFDGPGRAGALPDIEFPDAAAQDPKILADTLNSLNLSESTSLETRVRMLHEDWDDTQIEEEVEKIREDLSMLPEPKANFLDAALANNGSDTGGVLTDNYGVKGVNTAYSPAAPTTAPDQTKSGQLAPGPQPGPGSQ